MPVLIWLSSSSSDQDHGTSATHVQGGASSQSSVPVVALNPIKLTIKINYRSDTLLCTREGHW